MWLFNIAKTWFFPQNIVAWFVSKIPSVLEHNLGKYAALKRAFYLTAMEQLDGDYLEFGVFTGSSFGYSTRVHRELRYLGNIQTKFFGFDSFSGFGKVTEDDKHPFYIDGIFSVSAERVERNIRKVAGPCQVEIVKGYFDETLKGKAPQDFKIGKARIVFIDCDLKEPARTVLDFVRTSIQPGTVLVMDDFFSYKGDTSKGLAGAFSEFCTVHPELQWRRIFDYGYGGVAYIASSVSATATRGTEIAA